MEHYVNSAGEVEGIKTHHSIPSYSLAPQRHPARDE
jgi:hypothetical protein